MIRCNNAVQGTGQAVSAYLAGDKEMVQNIQNAQSVAASGEYQEQAQYGGSGTSGRHSTLSTRGLGGIRCCRLWMGLPGKPMTIWKVPWSLDPESSALRGIVMATLGQGRELMENSVEIKP